MHQRHGFVCPADSSRQIPIRNVASDAMGPGGCSVHAAAHETVHSVLD